MASYDMTFLTTSAGPHLELERNGRVLILIVLDVPGAGEVVRVLMPLHLLVLVLRPAYNQGLPIIPFTVYGLWFMVYGLWFMDGLWFMVYDLWLMVNGQWLMGNGLRLRV
jgi:hypothetical protein